MHDLTVVAQPSHYHRVLQFVQVEPRLGDGDGRAHVEAFRDLRREAFRRQMPPGIERHDAARLAPLREWTDARRRVGVGQIGTADRIERAGGDRERAIDRIGAAVAADDVAVLRPRHRADDRTALARGRRVPADRKALLGARRRMGGEADVVGAVRASHGSGPEVRPKMMTARRLRRA
jgi:hypothetical protein